MMWGKHVETVIQEAFASSDKKELAQAAAQNRYNALMTAPEEKMDESKPAPSGKFQDPAERFKKKG